jgi:hypothetical protein
VVEVCVGDEESPDMAASLLSSSSKRCLYRSTRELRT